jgi:CheY-like chemotaxis protein
VDSRPRRILIIDDDIGTLDTYARFLRLAGHVVVMARSAEAGLEAVAAGLPDAILLDLRMPEVDGLAFLRQLRAVPDARSLPVAIITGDYMANDVATAVALAELGAKLYFKPLWLDELSGVVNDLFHSP